MIKFTRKAISKTLALIAFPFGYAFIAIAVCSALIGGKSWSKVERDLNPIEKAFKQVKSSEKKEV